MKKKRNRSWFGKGLSLTLALSLCAGLNPALVFAQDDEETTSQDPFAYLFEGESESDSLEQIEDTQPIETDEEENNTQAEDTAGFAFGAPNAENLVVQKLVSVNGHTPGGKVQVGDILTYQISWNGSRVVIADPISPITDFYSASLGDLTLYANGQNPVSSENASISLVESIAYEGSSLANLESSGQIVVLQSNLGQGEAFINVMVNGSYQDSYINGQSPQVTNQLILQSGDQVSLSNELSQPIAFSFSEELFPGDGSVVKAGDEILYRIWFENSTDQAGQVLVEDNLPAGLSFKAAQYGDLYLSETEKVENDQSWISVNQQKLNAGLYLESGAIGYVDILTVVNGKAQNLINHQAKISVGSESQNTNLLQNPLPGSQIGQIYPGSEELVAEGEYLTYRIYYQNDLSVPADVSILSPLDVQTQYIGSVSEGTLVDSKAVSTLALNTALENGQDNNGQVYWNLENIDANSSGYVTLTVQAQSLDSGDPITSQAGIQVSDQNWMKTNILSNPTTLALDDPTITETQINTTTVSASDLNTQANGNIVGPGVNPQDTITYQIDFSANSNTNGSIKVTDTLDYYVTFVSASYKDKTLKATNSGNLKSEGFTISYDTNTRTVTWDMDADTLTNSSGRVFLTVQVANNAYLDAQQVVENSATVDTGAATTQKTVLMQNPVYPKMTEITPGADTYVAPGTSVTYNISVINNTGTAQNVIIFNPLNAGTNFEAAYLEAYKEGLTGATSTSTSYSAEGAQVEYYKSGEDLPPSVEGMKLSFPDDWKYTLADGLTYNGFVLWYLPSVPAGETSVALTVNVNSSAYVILSNQAIVQIGGDAFYTNPVYNDLNADAMNYQNGFAFGMTQQVGTTGSPVSTQISAYSGNVITYAMTIRNNSGAAVTDFKIWDPVPAGMSVLATSLTDGGAYNATNNAIEWNIGNFAADQTLTLSFQLQLPAANLQSTYTNTAYASFTNAEGTSLQISSPALLISTSTGTSGTTTAPNQNTGVGTNATLLIAAFVIALVILAGVVIVYIRKKKKA